MSVVSVTVTKCVVASMSLVTGTVTVNVTKCVGASMSTLSYPEHLGYKGTSKHEYIDQQPESQ
jgi:hypothetical protein